MSREQKGAWFIVAMFAASVMAYLILLPFMGPVPALGAFGLMGLTMFWPLIFRKRRDPLGVEIDERDRVLQRKATLAGAMISYGVFLLGCMGVWFYYFTWQGQQMVSVHLFPGAVFAGGITLWVARSVAMLVLYGRE